MIDCHAWMLMSFGLKEICQNRNRFDISLVITYYYILCTKPFIVGTLPIRKIKIWNTLIMIKHKETKQFCSEKNTNKHLIIKVNLKHISLASWESSILFQSGRIQIIAMLLTIVHCTNQSKHKNFGLHWCKKTF